jgi:hypothetical protein
MPANMPTSSNAIYLVSYVSRQMKRCTWLFKKKFTLSEIYFTKTTDAKFHVLCMDGKEISQSSDLNLPPGAHTIILCAKGCYVQNGGKCTGESFLHAGIRQDNISVKCAMTFMDTLWKESANQEVYLRLVQVWEELDYRFDICHVTHGAHIECL